MPDRPGLDPRDLQPAFHSVNRAMPRAPERHSNFAPGTLLVGLALADRHQRALARERDVFQVQRNQFGAAQGTGPTQQQHGAVPDVLRMVSEPVEDGEQVIAEKGLRLPLLNPKGPAHAAQCRTHQLALGRVICRDRSMGFADRGQPPL